MKQLFANNAKTTLVNSITSSSLSLVVDNASIFPIPSSPEDFFLVTIESGSNIEICEASSISGSTIVLSKRGQEGTTAISFPAGSRVENRVTKDTLGSFNKNFSPLPSVDLLTTPSSMYREGFIANTFDTKGSPTIVVRKNPLTWRFLNYQLQASGVVTASTSTSATTSLAGTATSPTPGKYLIQITSGAYAGYVREVSSASTTDINWLTALPGALATGTSLEIHKANSAIYEDLNSVGDDALIMAIVFGA